MKKLRQALFSQNFLHNRVLVGRLVRSSCIGKSDLVLEIGPGKGIITEPLLAQAQHVIAVEVDSKYCQYLRDKFGNDDRLTIYNQDILSYSLPKVPYKVFANIPFSIEGKIVRKLIDAENPPEDCYLVMMKELAYRLSAPHKENQFSLMHKPWFEMTIEHFFKREDFSPYSNVDSVLFRFTKRQQPLLPYFEIKNYRDFIQKGFGEGLFVSQNLAKSFGREKTTGVLGDLGIKRSALPNQLTLDQWIKLYQRFQMKQ